MNEISIWTDGACSGNGNENSFGGFAAILEYRNHRLEISGHVNSEDNPTNNRMELIAVIEAIKTIKKSGYTVKIFSDSQYVIEGVKSLREWRKNNWKTKAKSLIKNRELWEELISVSVASGCRFEFEHVKGHDICFNNTLCDQIAKSEAKKAKMLGFTKR